MEPSKSLAKRTPPSSAQGGGEWTVRDCERLRGGGGLSFGCSFAPGFPGPWHQLVDFAGWMIGRPCKHVSEPGARIDIIELAGLNQRINRCRATAALVGAGEGPVAAADGNRPVILPISGRRSRSIIVGIRFTGSAFGGSTASGAAAGSAFTSSRRPALRASRRARLASYITYSWNAVSEETPLSIRGSSRRSRMHRNSPKPLPPPPAPGRVPRQLSLALNSIPLPAMNPAERAKAIASLAIVLMEASGISMGERADDER